MKYKKTAMMWKDGMGKQVHQPTYPFCFLFFFSTGSRILLRALHFSFECLFCFTRYRILYFQIEVSSSNKFNFPVFVARTMKVRNNNHALHIIIIKCRYYSAVKSCILLRDITPKKEVKIWSIRIKDCTCLALGA